MNKLFDIIVVGWSIRKVYHFVDKHGDARARPIRRLPSTVQMRQQPENNIPFKYS